MGENLKECVILKNFSALLPRYLSLSYPEIKSGRENTATATTSREFHMIRPEQVKEYLHQLQMIDLANFFEVHASGIHVETLRRIDPTRAKQPDLA